MVCFGVQGYIFISRRFGLVEFCHLNCVPKRSKSKSLWSGAVMFSSFFFEGLGGCEFSLKKKVGFLRVTSFTFPYRNPGIQVSHEKPLRKSPILSDPIAHRIVSGWLGVYIQITFETHRKISVPYSGDWISRVFMFFSMVIHINIWGLESSKLRNWEWLAVHLWRNLCWCMNFCHHPRLPEK